MSIPFPKTKLHIPPVWPDPSTGLRASLVPHPRLIDRLNAGSNRKLTLLSAPAGFGKTTLPRELWSDDAEEHVPASVQTWCGAGPELPRGQRRVPGLCALAMRLLQDLPDRIDAWLNEGEDEAHRFLSVESWKP